MCLHGTRCGGTVQAVQALEKELQNSKEKEIDSLSETMNVIVEVEKEMSGKE